MTEQILYCVLYALLLCFGTAVSAAFAGVDFTKRSLTHLLMLTALCGILQGAVCWFWGEDAVWKLYPVITHLPILLALKFCFGKQLPHAVSAITTAYLCCQPAKWCGLAACSLFGSTAAEVLVRIAVLMITLAVLLRWFSGTIAKLYSPDHRSPWMFGIIPVVYYLFDYAVGIYSSLWADTHRLVVEFLPCFLCIGHILFCAVYYREYELKQQSEHKEQILRITVEQQTREVEMIRRSEQDIRRLRHDLRLLLNSLSSCIEHSDKETARKLIAGFSHQVETPSIKRYCENDTLNYVLSDYAARCQEKGIRFQPVIELSELTVDEILFSIILANALDNALNAQEGLTGEDGSSEGDIRILLKNSSGKTLLSVKNTFREPPQFRDGQPVSFRKGRGYGVQSILYITETLGGNCQFVIEDNRFVLRVVV